MSGKLRALYTTGLQRDGGNNPAGDESASVSMHDKTASENKWLFLSENVFRAWDIFLMMCKVSQIIHEHENPI